MEVPQPPFLAMADSYPPPLPPPQVLLQTPCSALTLPFCACSHSPESQRAKENPLPPPRGVSLLINNRCSRGLEWACGPPGRLAKCCSRFFLLFYPSGSKHPICHLLNIFHSTSKQSSSFPRLPSEHLLPCLFSPLMLFFLVDAPFFQVYFIIIFIVIPLAALWMQLMGVLGRPWWLAVSSLPVPNYTSHFNPLSGCQLTSKNNMVPFWLTGMGHEAKKPLLDQRG